MKKRKQTSHRMAAYRDQKGGRKPSDLKPCQKRKDSLFQWIRKWLEGLEQEGYAAQSIQTYYWALHAFEEWGRENGMITTTKLTPDKLERYRIAVLSYRKQNGDPLCINSQRMRLQTVQRFCLWLKKKEVIDLTPELDQHLPRKQPRSLPKSLSVRQITLFIEAPSLKKPIGIRDRAILELFYTSGIRRWY